MDVSGLRREYRGDGFDAVGNDPMALFRVWFEEAVQAAHVKSRDPNAMSLSTVDAQGRPSGRIVLLKGFDRQGFVFYTNYGSRKARDLEANPWASLTFWWDELDRQVRVEGRAERTDRATSEAYFASRPRESQLAAVASAQSRPLADRATLLAAVEALRKKYEGRDVPCPEEWGGYLLRPHALEFWQGRPNRLHDRLAYRLDEAGAWKVERLGP